MKTKKCAYCGKVFAKKSNVSQKEWDEQTKYCSRKCYWSAKEQERDIRICPQCGKEFVYLYWYTKQAFCSRSCANKSRANDLPSCEICGKPVKRYNRRFCSRECKVEWYQGNEVYNYLGGRARHHYASTYWLKIAEQVRERDKVCQRCGKPPVEGRKLHVHHIEPWRISQNDDLSNLQALCPSCHKKADAELERRNL